MAKIASPVSDYAMNYDLLHYHYDRWLFKTITGAINSAKQAQCSPTTALEAKTFPNKHGLTAFFRFRFKSHGDFPKL